MAKARPSFEKLERDRNKRAKQAAKRERRQARAEETEDGVDEPATPPVDEAAVLAQLEALHEQFDAEKIDFDTFEERRAELLGRLTQS